MKIKTEYQTTKIFQIQMEKNIRLFDLKNDPQEEKNIADERIDVVKKMEEILTQFTMYSNVDGEVLSDEEIKKAKETLLRLGYI